MTEHLPGRRDFFKAAGAAGLILNAAQQASALPLTEKDKLARIASNTWPMRYLFKSRTSGRRPNPQADAMKKKYGEITMLDFPQFTRDTFPGVTHMDLWSGVFGDVSDDSMYAQSQVTFNGNTRTMYEFDPSTPSIEEMARETCGKDGGHRGQMPPRLQ